MRWLHFKRNQFSIGDNVKYLWIYSIKSNANVMKNFHSLSSIFVRFLRDHRLKNPIFSTDTCEKKGWTPAKVMHWKSEAYRSPFFQINKNEALLVRFVSIEFQEQERRYMREKFTYSFFFWIILNGDGVCISHSINVLSKTSGSRRNLS